MLEWGEPRDVLGLHVPAPGLLLRLVFLASSGDQVHRVPHGRLAMGGAALAAVVVIAYAFFANPISGLAVQGAAAVGLR